MNDSELVGYDLAITCKGFLLKIGKNVDIDFSSNGFTKSLLFLSICWKLCVVKWCFVFLCKLPTTNLPNIPSILISNE